jgi:hypothetical protein
VVACFEYLAAEILELAGNAARDNKKSHINPRHLQLADRELLSHTRAGSARFQRRSLTCSLAHLLGF